MKLYWNFILLHCTVVQDNVNLYCKYTKSGKCYTHLQNMVNIVHYLANVHLLLCGPILPCVQTVWEEARPNTILIRTKGARKGRPNIKCEGKRISEDSWPMNGQNYRPRRGGAYLWGIGSCPRMMVTSGLLSEVSGELVNHSEQRLGQTL